ncbi:MAG: ArsR family transcriptional regulator [Anaerolineae bacterium]|nr:MAG: ArsR family transcriptional regulator [Anaerolineae bacterium]
MSTISSLTAKKISRILRQISHPARVHILLTIGEGEACVCHLEASLGYRQAYISQHLMALRKAGLLAGRREGRFIFYRLKNPQLLDLLAQAAALTGVSQTDLKSPLSPEETCCCPRCMTEGSDPEGIIPLPGRMNDKV